MWEAPYCPSHLQVDPTIIGMGFEIILLDNQTEKQGQWHYHVLEVFKGSGEGHIFNIEAHIFHVWHAHDTVPMQLCGVNVHGADTEFTIVCDLIAHDRNPDLIRIIFGGSVIDNRICKPKKNLLAICVSGFVMSHNEHCIRAFLPGFIIALCHTSKILTKYRLPYFHGSRIIHQLFENGDSFARHGMHHRIRVMFKIDVGQCQSVVAENAWRVCRQRRDSFPNCYSS